MALILNLTVAAQFKVALRHRQGKLDQPINQKYPNSLIKDLRETVFRGKPQAEMPDKIYYYNQLDDQ